MNEDVKEFKRDRKICQVCGDTALGYNFNALTCESCKAFFRRNACKEKELRCPFLKESCEITPITRRFCQKCRLNKCLQVGMKKELIMSDVDKEKKRKMKALPQQEHDYCCTLTDPCEITSITTKLCEKCRLKQNKVIRVKKELTMSIEENEKKRRKKVLPQQEQRITSSVSKELHDICIQTDFPSCSCSRLNNSLLDTAAYPPEVSTPLSAEDKVILNELVSATKALEAPVDQELSNLPGEEFKICGSESLIDVINLTAIAIRRLIKMCKRVWGFRSLQQTDQLSLLKQGCTQMMLLRSVVNFDPVKNSWKIPHSVDELSRIKVEVLKEARGNLYEAHETWLRGFDPRASHDLRVICLLTAIALFDPTRSHLSNSDIIKLTQDRYYEILRRYLESLCRIGEAHEIYNNLIGKMTELRGLNDEYVRVYLNVDPSQVEPLLIEIFDLRTQLP